MWGDELQINDDVIKDMFVNLPVDNRKYVLMVNDAALHEKILLLGYGALLIDSLDKASRYMDIISNSIISGGTAREYIFMVAFLTKDISKALQEDFNRYGLPLDTQAYKIFYKKSIAHLTNDKLLGYISDYISKSINTDTSNDYEPWIVIKIEKDGLVKPSGVNEGLLAEHIIETLKYFVVRNENTSNEEIRLYKDGIYEFSSKSVVKSYIKEYLPSRLVKSSLLNNVYDLILSSTNNVKAIEDFDSNENIINLKNGLYNIEENKLYPHSPDVLNSLQLNCSYGPSAKAPAFEKFINDLCTSAEGQFDKQKKLLLQEWAGIIISNVPGYRVKKCLLLYSALGNTGKTVFIKTLGDIIGQGSVINIAIQNLSDRFSMGDIYGKKLISASDQKGGEVEDSSTFKQLTGGDPLRVEQKGKTGFNYLFNGCMVITCNMLPRFKDDKGGHVFERLTLFECENVIQSSERNPHLHDLISKEFSGIFLWAMEGLRRLIKNDFRFTECEAVNEIMQSYRSQSDTIYSFIMENCELTNNLKNDRIKKTEFENNYKVWCIEKEVTPLSNKNISERMLKNGIRLIKTMGEHYYQGIKYTEPSEFIKVKDNEDQSA